MHKLNVRVNAPSHTDAREKKPFCWTDPKGVSVVQRAKEFSSELITISAGKLFCSVCREELPLKLSNGAGSVMAKAFKYIARTLSLLYQCLL